MAKRRARPQAGRITAKYDAAGTGRRIANWRAPSTGPVKAVEGVARLRDRARDATRNDWAGASASQKWGSNLIGVGIRPRFNRVPEGDARRRVVDWFADWAQYADADGVLDYYGMQTLAVRSWFDSGEVFLRLRPRRIDSGLLVPFQMQLLESDFVPFLTTNTWPGLPAGNTITQGIERNSYGKRTAYWMYRSHPGDGEGMVSPEQTIRVPAYLVRHIYEPTRPGQMRGVSQMAAALTRLRLAADLEDTVATRQQLANLYMAVVTKQLPENLDDVELDPDTGLPVWYADDSRPVSELGQGIVQELAPGESMTFANPPEPGISHPDYMRTLNLGTSAVSGLPHEVLTGDIRNVSDRALRIILLEFRRLARQRQWQMVIPQFCQPAIDGFAQALVLRGLVGPDEAEQIRRVEHAPEGWEHIHPVQDPQGKILEIEAGIRSRDGVISDRGDDPATVDKERQEGQARERSLGLGAALETI